MDKMSASTLKRSICLRRLDLKSLVDNVCDTFAETFTEQGIDVDLDVPQNLWVELDPILMCEALRKLIDNAAEAMPTGGVLTITSLIGRQGLEIEVADSGPGILEELSGKLFEPLVSGKEDHAGLGLSMVREIVAAHEGTITATDCPDGGAAFTLMLPLRSGRIAA